MGANESIPRTTANTNIMGAKESTSAANAAGLLDSKQKATLCHLLSTWTNCRDFNTPSSATPTPNSKEMVRADDPPRDVINHPDKYVYVVSMPGFRDVQAKVDQNNVLEITGKRSRLDNGNGTYLVMGRRVGEVQGRFRVPFDANTNEMKTEKRGGLVTITFPKHAPVDQPREIS